MEKSQILESHQILIFQLKIKLIKMLSFKNNIFHKNFKIKLINSKENQYIDI